MKEDDRLYVKHQQDVKDLGKRIVDQRRFLRANLGPGGTKLSRLEQLMRYMEQRNDPEAQRRVLQMLQQRYHMQPHEVPRDYRDYLIRGERLMATVGGKQIAKERGYA